mgnify:CR=1 FL=1
MELVKDYEKIRVYNPALPEVQERIVNIVKEIITKYDVTVFTWMIIFILIRLRDKISQIMRALFVMVRILPIKEIGGVIM